MTYLSRPIFDLAPDWSQEITRRLVYDLRVQQVGFGAEVDEPLQRYTADGYTVGLDLGSPCAINALERFVAGVYGRLRGFWLPSPAWLGDIVAGVSSTEFLIRRCGLAETWTDLPALHLYLRPDAVDVGQAVAVTAVTAVNAETEKITLAAPLADGVPDAAWVAQRLLYVRLVEDGVTLEFVREGHAKASLQMLELPVEYASVELGQRPAFAYHFWRQVGAVRHDWYYTSFDRELSVGTVAQQHVCTPAPIGHEAISQTTAGDRERLDVRSWRFEGSPFAAFQPFAPQHDLFCEVLEVDLASGAPAVATTVFAGLVETVEPTGRALRVRCTTRLDRLGAKMPRFRVQKTCGYELFGPCCGVSRAAYTVMATVASADPLGLTLVLTAAGFAGKPKHWFRFGNAEVIDGDGLPQFRTVIASAPTGGTQQTIRLNAPFSSLPAIGSTVQVAAGCDLSYLGDNGCGKFGNKINYGGHPRIAGNLSLKALPLQSGSAGKGGGK